jgi:predicted Na+-dependent transporter
MILLGLVLVPLLLGYVAHQYFKTHQNGSWRGPWHTWVARAFIVLSLVDGFLIGPNLIYVSLAAIIIIAYLGYFGVDLYRRKQEDRRQTRLHEDAKVTGQGLAVLEQ